MGERKDLSRRQLLGASAGAGVVAVLGLPTARADAEQRAAGLTVRTTQELVLVNGRIHTMDGNNTVVDSVSIRNGRFSAVGGAAPAQGPGIRVIDL